jgi:hypothetical protein
VVDLDHRDGSLPVRGTTSWSGTAVAMSSSAERLRVLVDHCDVEVKVATAGAVHLGHGVRVQVRIGSPQSPGGFWSGWLGGVWVAGGRVHDRHPLLVNTFHGSPVLFAFVTGDGSAGL